MFLSRALGVIPARLGSERLPRKPLQPLAGRPLIEWVWRRVVAFKSLAHVVIATDSEEVAVVCYSFGADVEMTLATHGSGTERVAEVAARAAYGNYDVVVNVQGDEPFIEETHVMGALQMVMAGFDIGTVAAPVQTLDDWNDPAVVKIARAENGRALYFSRAPIPCRRDAEPTAQQLSSEAYLRHIGVYAYGCDALARWVALPVTYLEQLEKLEQLRPLAAGMSIGVSVVPAAPGGIDTPADLERATQMLQEGS